MSSSAHCRMRAMAGLRAPITARLTALPQHALRSPELITRSRKNVAITRPVGAAEFNRFHAAEEQRFGELARATGAQIE